MRKSILILCLLINITNQSSNINATSIFIENINTISHTDINIPYIEAKGYFIKNTVKENQYINPIIKSQKKFQELFGAATVMGSNGKPTDIDFNKQYVVAVIGKTTNKACVINPISLIKKNKTIILNYNITESKETLSYYSRPLLLLIIDNSHQEKIKLVKQ